MPPDKHVPGTSKAKPAAPCLSPFHYTHRSHDLDLKPNYTLVQMSLLPRVETWQGAHKLNQRRIVGDATYTDQTYKRKISLSWRWVAAAQHPLSDEIPVVYKASHFMACAYIERQTAPVKHHLPWLASKTSFLWRRTSLHLWLPLKQCSMTLGGVYLCTIASRRSYAAKLSFARATKVSCGARARALSCIDRHLQCHPRELFLAQDKHSGNYIGSQTKIQSFSRLTKMGPKQWKKINGNLLQLRRRVAKLLAGAREVVTSMLQSSTWLLLKQIVMPSYNKSYLVSKKFPENRLPCTTEQLLKLEFRCSSGQCLDFVWGDWSRA